MRTQRTRFEMKYDDKIETVNYVCYISKTNLLALCYVGKSAKPAFYYRYRTVAQLYESVKTRLANYDSHFREKAERAAKIKELSQNFDVKKHVKIGEIICNSWGYDQTNIEFYQVVGFVGRTKIQIKELQQESISKDGYSSMSCFVIPLKDQFYSKGDEYTLTCKASEREPFFHICCPGGHSYYYFHVWSGREEYKSWYA